ncbi:Scr1 family TA system antitoxin-like transcriptional regulator [Streptomyces sp. NPDC127033]|uniref:Scr1 family TA system antitoxin-like transcriptional regulator n=1 Tax=Streptomyces sp. NPDC127033 TaxID=3347110 RepID=UPI00366646E4
MSSGIFHWNESDTSRISTPSPRRSATSLGAEPAPEVVAYDTTMSTVLLEDLEDMAVHAKIFEALRSAALTTGQSLAFIRQTLKGIPADKDAKERE